MRMQLAVQRWRAFWAALVVVLGGGCWSATANDTTVSVTIHMQLRTARQSLGAISGKVLAYEGNSVASRFATATPARSCEFGSSTTATCEFTVPRNHTVTFIAVESVPDLTTAFRAAQTSDTVRSGKYVEFARWTTAACQVIDPGVCTLDARENIEVSAEFELMTQVTVYQIGASRFDFVIVAPLTPLTVPPQQSNVLNGYGCTRLVLNEGAAPCDDVHVVGATPWHRLTAYLTRNSAIILIPNDGTATGFREWDNGCSLYVGTNGCELVFTVRDSTGAAYVATLKSEYWQCPAGPSDRDLGGCTLVRP